MQVCTLELPLDWTVWREEFRHCMSFEQAKMAYACWGAGQWQIYIDIYFVAALYLQRKTQIFF